MSDDDAWDVPPGDVDSAPSVEREYIHFDAERFDDTHIDYQGVTYRVVAGDDGLALEDSDDA